MEEQRMRLKTQGKQLWCQLERVDKGWLISLRSCFITTFGVIVFE